jgi:hypothetical protein
MAKQSMVTVEFLHAGTFKGKNIRTITSRVYDKSYGFRERHSVVGTLVLDNTGWIVDEITAISENAKSMDELSLWGIED